VDRKDQTYRGENVRGREENKENRGLEKENDCPRPPVYKTGKKRRSEAVTNESLKRGINHLISGGRPIKRGMISVNPATGRKGGLGLLYPERIRKMGDRWGRP